MKIIFVTSKENIADVFMKNTNEETHLRHSNNFGLNLQKGIPKVWEGMRSENTTSNHKNMGGCCEYVFLWSQIKCE